MGQDPRLDGLRGIAILLVAFKHGGYRLPFEGLAGQVYRTAVDLGGSGVDLFFVLSGFLITRILLRTRDEPAYLRNFYARRTLRIFPVYYLWLFFLLVLVPQIEFFDRLSSNWTLGVSSLWYWLYASNVAVALHAAWLHPLLSITWSLAIEEQFYLIWPWAVRGLTRRRLVILCLGCIALAPLLRTAVFVAEASPLLAFVLTPCRFDLLAAGALVAVVSGDPGGPARLLHWAGRVLPVSALGIVLVTVAIRAGWVPPGPLPDLVLHPLMYTVGYSLLTALFTSVLVFAAFGPEARTRFFAFPLLRTFGRYSYAMYLTHTFVGGLVLLYFFNPADHPGWGGALAASALELGAQLGVAMLIWYLFESHFLRLKTRFA